MAPESTYFHRSKRQFRSSSRIVRRGLNPDPLRKAYLSPSRTLASRLANRHPAVPTKRKHAATAGRRILLMPFRLKYLLPLDAKATD